MSDQDIENLENKFPAVSGSAFAAARERALASGQSVLQSEEGAIYEVFPDGTRRRIEDGALLAAVERMGAAAAGALGG